MAAPVAKTRTGLPIKGLISALVGIALFATAILFVLLWQDTMRPHGGHGVPPAEGSSVASGPASTALAQPEQGSSALEVALTSPNRIEANAGEVIAFPIAIDATEALPPRSIVAISALPDGASFSEGRPYGVSGWSLRPDEIGDLRLRLPARSGTSDMRLELVTGDGTVLSQSETRLSIAPSPAEAETVGAIESDSSEPQAPAEWMETKTAVDMHARAQQSSETVKVAEKGIKVRVTARDKNWVQVNDPTSSVTGWIYNRFLKPTEPPAQ